MQARIIQLLGWNRCCGRGCGQPQSSPVLAAVRGLIQGYFRRSGLFQKAFPGGRASRCQASGFTRLAAKDNYELQGCIALRCVARAVRGMRSETAIQRNKKWEKLS